MTRLRNQMFSKPDSERFGKSAAALMLLPFLLLALNGCSSRVQPVEAKTASEPQTVSQAASDEPFKCEPTPARLERGRYLVEGIAHCFQCHSQIDWAKPGAQPMPGKKGAGFNWAPYGLPFVTAPNLTADKKTGAGNWTDQQFATAIRGGVGHDGRRLFPIMPYMNFKDMSDEDLSSVITYLRTLKPVRNELPGSNVPEQIRQTLPPVQLVSSVPQPDLSTPVARGKYLVTLGNCNECHTPVDQQHRPLPGLSLAGGQFMKGPWGEVTTPNLTPDASGLSYYDAEMFVQTIRSGQVKARKLNPIMPWGYFRNLTDDDLRAIFAYLQTLEPVKHVVDNTESPTSCRICGGTHGFGDRN
jgi:mono/diheme cytochrome c family protein